MNYMRHYTAMPVSQEHDPSSAKTVLSVSQLNHQARLTIEQRFSQVWVMGEMSNFARPRSGHWYFSLKDDSAQVRCAMFANRNRGVSLQPGDGQLVIARGRVSLYEGRGDFQIIIDHLEPAGEGALRQAFDKLKVKLATEGLFDQSLKQTLPNIPTHIAVVTSATGAAIKDVIAVWQRRYPCMRITVIPTAVQGDAAEQQIIQAIKQADALQPDALLLTRGGGSLEDLWSFNLESVARTLAACSSPTVSAIGHEIDTTICDYVADIRAPTPSAAAELMTPERFTLEQSIVQYARTLLSHWQRYHERLAMIVANLRLQIPAPGQVLEGANQRVDDAGERLQMAMTRKLEMRELQLQAQANKLAGLRPSKQLSYAKSQVRSLTERLSYAWGKQLDRQTQILTSLSRMLNTVSPLPTLGRGFAIVTTSTGDVATSVHQLQPGDITRTYLADGAIETEVTEIQPGQTIGRRPLD